MLTSENLSLFEAQAEVGGEVETTQILNAEQEHILAYQIRQGGSVGERARMHFIMANLRLVFMIAHPFKHVRGALEYSDLVQEGRIGLIQAVERFNPERGYRFSTYAVWRIQRAIIQALHDKKPIIRVPNYRWSALVHMQRAEQALIQQHYRLPSVEELAEAAGMTVELVETLRSVCNVLNLCSLDKPLDPDSEEGLKFDPGAEEELTLGDLLFSSDASTEERALANVFSTTLRSVLEEVLTRRERQVLALRFGFTGHEHTLAEIAHQFNVSRERVRQIEERALCKLRRPSVRAQLSA
jgi:RNA polymerase primary sigma factor